MTELREQHEPYCQCFDCEAEAGPAITLWSVRDDILPGRIMPSFTPIEWDEPGQCWVQPILRDEELAKWLGEPIGVIDDKQDEPDQMLIWPEARRWLDVHCPWWTQIAEKPPLVHAFREIRYSTHALRNWANDHRAAYDGAGDEQDAIDLSTYQPRLRSPQRITSGLDDDDDQSPVVTDDNNLLTSI